MNFLKKLKNTAKGTVEPFFVLAPMADVTDPAFRRMVVKYSKYGGQDIFDKEGKFTRPQARPVGGPDVMWTEFVSADGLCSIGREHLMIDLAYTEAERPIVAQLFTSNPANMREASKLCAELGFDGVDINMGCPDKSIEGQGAGACMIKNPESAKAVIDGAREGIRDAVVKSASRRIPVSVKTRIGYNKIDLEWIKILLGEKLDALTVHLRTRKEMSDVPAHWEIMPEIIKLRDEISPDTLIIGNGDVKNIEEGRELCMKYGCDGIMFGRAIFGNPWLFDELKGEVGIKEKLETLCEHVKLFEEILVNPPTGGKNFAIMKKHFKAYVNGFDGAKELRVRLMDGGNNANDVERIIKEFLNK